jgi:enamine deaminase RidA (YjgF/YER057c/UK114 family)
MKRALNPAAIRAPFGRYSHGVAVPSGARLVFCSGQLGLKAGDMLPPTVEGQAEVCFQNIAAILAEDGMSLADIVRIDAYVTKREDMRAYMSVRDRYVSEPLPASTLLIVGGFSRSEFLVEIEVTAAKVE